MSELDQEILFRAWAEARKRLVFIDFDGTLADFNIDPILVTRDSAGRALVSELTQHATVVIVSGRTANFLQKEFKGDQVVLVGEHGGIIRLQESAAWIPLPVVPSVSNAALDEIEQRMRHWNLKLPGSLIERKSLGCAFHIRGVDPSLVEALYPKLNLELMNLCDELKLNLLSGKRVLEVRNYGISKGAFIDWYVETQADRSDEKSSLFAFGDDVTDEDMFKVVNQRGGISVKVGNEASSAIVRFSSRSTFVTGLSKILNTAIAAGKVSPLE